METPTGIDWKRAKLTVGGDEGLLRELLGIYLGEAKGLIKEIHQAVEQGDHATIKRASHTLKGASLLTGATETSRLAQQLEASSTDMSQQQLVDLTAVLEVSVRKVIEDATEFIESAVG